MLGYNFPWLASRSEVAFLALMMGHSPNEAAKNRNYFQRDLARYAKHNHGNGKADDLQMRAVELLRAMDMRLWAAFKKRMCNHKFFMIDGEKIQRCAKHGNKLACRKTYEDWIKSVSY